MPPVVLGHRLVQPTHFALEFDRIRVDEPVLEEKYPFVVVIPRIGRTGVRGTNGGSSTPIQPVDELFRLHSLRVNDQGAVDGVDGVNAQRSLEKEVETGVQFVRE